MCNRLATQLPQSGGTASWQELDSLAPNQRWQDPGGWDSDPQGASGQRKGCLADPPICIHCTREGNSQCSANLTMILQPLCNCHIAVPLISLSSTCIMISSSIALQLAGKLVVHSTICTDLTYQESVLNAHTLMQTKTVHIFMRNYVPALIGFRGPDWVFVRLQP